MHSCNKYPLSACVLSSAVPGIGEAVVMSQAQDVERAVGTEQVRVIQMAGQGPWGQRKGGAYFPHPELTL